MSSQCPRCHGPLAGKPTVELSDQVIHEKCFRCIKCDKGFPDLKFTRDKGEFYHLKCLESSDPLQCFACKKEINGDFVRYNRQPFHKQCFTCSSCGTGLSGKTFGETQTGQPVCDPCLSGLSKDQIVIDSSKPRPTRVCKICDKKIDGASYALSNGHYVHPTCIRCSGCMSLIDSSDSGSFVESGGYFYHKPECFNKSRFENCAKCKTSLFGGGVPLKGGKYHEECLNCAVCNSTMVGKELVIRDAKVFCRTCLVSKLPSATPSANEKVTTSDFGTQDKCPKCKKPVYVSDQVYGPQATVWHTKCLVCTECGSKVGSSAKVVDGLIYCSFHAKPKVSTH